MNLFSRLDRYRNQQEENFFTEAFVGLLEQDKDLLYHMVSKITKGLALQKSDAQIDSQVPEEFDNRKLQYDVRVTDKDSIVIIENKVGSQAGEQQLDRYAAKLNSEVMKKNRYLVFLTQKYEKPWESPYPSVKFIQWRWFEIYRFFEEYPTSRKGLIGQFMNFMEAKGMSIKKVSGGLFAGAEALYNLLQQIESAGKEEGFSRRKNRKEFDEEWSGLWFEYENQFVWVGINYTIDATLIIEFINSGKLDSAYRELAGKIGGSFQPDNEGTPSIKINLNSKRYFDKEVKDQVEILRRWFAVIKEQFNRS